MGTGTLTLALAGLLWGQAADEVLHTNQRALRIPINFQDARRAELSQLLLYASWDLGRNYQQVASVLPDKNEFAFEARNDGTCWLRVAVINRQGKQEPDNIQRGPPDRKIVIDTMKPVVRTFTAQRQGDEVALAWEILEDHFDPQGFRLEYQAKDNPSSFWTKIEAAAALTGQFQFRPTSAGPLNVRLIARDLGGSQSFANAEVGGGINAVGFTPPAPVASNLAPAVIPPPAPPPLADLGSQPLPPPMPPEPVKQIAAPAAPVNQAPPLKGVPAAIAGSATAGSATAGSWAPAAAKEPLGQLLATSQTVSNSPPAPAAPPSTPAPVSVNRKTPPPMRYVNHAEIVLEYELAKVGPSGVGSVDLWWTQNDGQSWELGAFVPDVNGTIQNGKHQRTVELPGDGVYGFILAVKSRAGLGKPPPRAGDAPEIRVEVDTVPPLAHLHAPIPDPQKPGALLLNWVAKDNNLTNLPITWEYAERREGPWVPIAVNIANQGRYSWQLPEVLPVQVYLRLRVRDMAGNESVAVTPEPQLVDLSEPEGRLLNVTVPPRRP